MGKLFQTFVALCRKVFESNLFLVLCTRIFFSDPALVFTPCLLLYDPLLSISFQKEHFYGKYASVQIGIFIIALQLCFTKFNPPCCQNCVSNLRPLFRYNGFAIGRTGIMNQGWSATIDRPSSTILLSFLNCHFNHKLCKVILGNWFRSPSIERRDLAIPKTSPKRSVNMIEVPIPQGPTDTK